MARITGADRARRHARQLLSVTAVVLMSATFGSAVTASQADEVSSADVTPVIEGTLPPSADVQDVSLFMMPSDTDLLNAPIGAELPLTEVVDPQVETVDNTFSVTLPPEGAPDGLLDANGTGSFAVMVLTDEGVYQSNMSVRAVVGPDGEAQWADPEAPVVADAQGNTAKTRVSSMVLPRSKATTSETQRLNRFVKLPMERAKSMLSMRGEPTPPAGCGYKKLGSQVRSTTIGTTYPVSEDNAKMVVNSSSGASYGTAVSVKTSGSWGAFKTGESKFTQSGWGFSWDPWADARSYRKGVEYGLYELSCSVGCWSCSKTWFPVGETGGTGENRGIARPDFGNCQLVSGGSWWRDNSSGSAYTNDAAVDFSGVIGIDLSISRQYNGNQKLLYNLNKQRRMCGSNDWPSTAGKVMSRFAS